jgi:hypothetical protein
MELKDIFFYFLMLIFIMLGIMNIIEVSIYPGVAYLIISLIYCPPLGNILQRYLAIKVPYWLKTIIAFIVLWGTLAVGDLAELHGF